MRRSSHTPEDALDVQNRKVESPPRGKMRLVRRQTLVEKPNGKYDRKTTFEVTDAK